MGLLIKKTSNHPSPVLSSFRSVTLNYIGYSYGIFEAEQLIQNAKYLWTFDDKDDIKDQQGKTWVQQSSFLQTTAGIRGQAAKTEGGSGPILLVQDTSYYLSRPTHHASVTVSLWLLYQSTGVSQTFLAAGDQENSDTGIHLHQEDGSREELTFSTRVNAKMCSVKFGVPQLIWTHLIFTWSAINSVLTPTTAYLDGNIITDMTNVCTDGSYPDLPSNAITLGSSTLPTASIDDVMVLGESLSTSQVDKLFRYYKGEHGHFRI